ncbi:hypothetical protein CPB84DRAFT_1817396 [Gymnopilus junonius]|uniref:Tyrosinase copper-binding domain-containing protein n=1 Tax=Gymnopilus junonius TaxID=109634 RepID=A0A9P5TIB4_GYMJU|nr:hypothetical protein CPB84DRAFT_1817396 [Gymnopilus junonius]
MPTFRHWRTLGRATQKEYLNAVHCMLKTVSRFDDFVTAHILQTFSIRYVCHFLPWHRYFIAIYWNWNLDVPPLGNFDAEFGFGGNGPLVTVSDDDPFAIPGRTGGGCITNGPFRNMVVNMGPTSNPNFGWFDRVVEGDPSFDASGLHGGGHYSVGGTLGEMGDLYNSPSDPKKDLSRRVADISGPIFILDNNNTLRGNVTWSFSLSLGVNAPNASSIYDVPKVTLVFLQA